MGDYWEDNGIEKPQQVVVCAACKDPHTGLLLTGARHWDNVMRNQFENLRDPVAKPSYWDEGFMDQFGDYLTREEAMKIVKDNGQPFNAERNGWPEHKLFSEGLY